MKVNVIIQNSVGGSPQFPIPIAIKLWQGLIYQNSTNNPILTVIKNNIGEELTFTRSSAGLYTATTTQDLNQQKTQIFVADQSLAKRVECYISGQNELTISQNQTGTPWAGEDGILYASLTIKIFK